MTYNEISMALADAGIENNRGEASMLICRFCDVNKAELLLRHDDDFDSAELEEAVKKRCSHYPLQYILGYWEFCHEMLFQMIYSFCYIPLKQFIQNISYL